MLSLVVFAVVAQMCSAALVAHESSYAPRRLVDQAPVVFASHASDYMYQHEPVHTQRLVVEKPVVHTAAVQYVEPAVHFEPAVHLEQAVRVEPMHANPTQ